MLKNEIFAARVDDLAIPDRENGVEGFSCQVTFIERRFVIGVSKHHFVCDGTAIANLITWWFKKARGYRTDNTVQDSKIVPVSKMMTLHDRSPLLLEPQAEPQERRGPNGVHSSSPTVVNPTCPKISTSSLDPLSSAVRTEVSQAIFRLGLHASGNSMLMPPSTQSAKFPQMTPCARFFGNASCAHASVTEMSKGSLRPRRYLWPSMLVANSTHHCLTSTSPTARLVPRHPSQSPSLLPPTHHLFPTSRLPFESPCWPKLRTPGCDLCYSMQPPHSQRPWTGSWLCNAILLTM